jgi:hypothetical protein
MLAKNAGIARSSLTAFGLAFVLLGINSANAQQPRRFGAIQTERGLEFGTKNFIAVGPTTGIAKRVAEEAERQRSLLAKLWLGKEIPDWPKRCPIQVQICPNCGGSTNFDFINCRDGGPQVCMNLQGNLDAILANVLPHEMTHVVLATFFQKPVPRWADEAAAMLSESKPRCEQYCQAFLCQPGPRRMYGVRDLFCMREYPGEPKLFYDQSYSIANYLVGRKDRATFLMFVRTGINSGWERAAKDCYDFNTLAGLETAWLAAINDPPKAASATSISKKADASMGSTAAVGMSP